MYNYSTAQKLLLNKQRAKERKLVHPQQAVVTHQIVSVYKTLEDVIFINEMKNNVHLYEQLLYQRWEIQSNLKFSLPFIIA